MRKYSYERVLGAVGRALDCAQARSFTVCEHEQGLVLEALTGEEQQPLSVTLQLADLVELVDWSAQADATPQHGGERNTSALHDLLARHEARQATLAEESEPVVLHTERRELVGASR